MALGDMLHTTLSVEEGHTIAIPSRSSSISRTGTTLQPNDRRMAARRSLAKENGGHLSFLYDDPNTADTRSASSFPADKMNSPSKMNRGYSSCAAPSRNSTHNVKVQRWDGLTRSVCNWDGLRKDSELWIPNGNCLVHLYAIGASRRGPSFSVPLRALRQKSCGAMLEICYAQTTAKTSAGLPESRRMHTFDNLNRESSIVELYIPAPEHASREESFDWHLTTRNFFAFVLGKPLVGRQMGQAFAGLYERMKLFRSKHINNHQDFLVYAETQGYRDLVECTDYALASLYYAERYKLRDVWIDAFAHCVGMSNSVALSPEYTAISRLSKALISRAYLEVDVHLGRVAKALRTFLEDDFSPAYLGLADGARNHLHRFRKFLHHFYVEKFGYWPPPKTAPYPKALYKSMFYDFKSLYDLLVDTESQSDIAFQKPASGGICVLQTVDHFDRRYKFTAQPHTLPLLPAGLGQTTTRSFSSTSLNKKTRDLQMKSAALVAATNSLSIDTEQPKIVQAYLEFERTHAANSSQREDKVTPIDARKVRWLLIYGTLQYLTSALRAPQGVRDVESPDYPLCCLVAGQQAWNLGTPIATPPVCTQPANSSLVIDDYFGGVHRSPSPTIQPDCQREDYFTPQTAARRGPADANAPPKPQLPTRQSSTRTFGPLSSLSSKGSRRNSLILKPASHCPIMVQGYGDGLNQATTQTSSLNVAESKGVAESHRLSRSTLGDGSSNRTSWLKPQDPSSYISKPTPGHTRTRTPLLITSQLEHVVQIADSDDPDDSMSRSDSTGSKGSVWTDEGSAASSNSSGDCERHPFYKVSTAEHSGLLGGLVAVDGTRVSLDVPESTSQKDIHPLLRTSSIQNNNFQFDFGVDDTEAVNYADTAGSIGMAFSAPPSPPLQKHASPNAPVSRTMSLITQKTPYITGPNTTTSSLAPDATSRRKSRSSDILSGLISSPGELRDRYNNAIRRLESPNNVTPQHGHLSTDSTSGALPPTVTKTSHATKMPSLRNRIWHDDNNDKKERRMSSFWRR
ncbi:hypothetical protein CC86DRAFT_69475 [Ophiobolus disseminans]|uniref:DUF8004 domain-containing protein n=1 Tax=Ophiobolus disseminans TaxID=1469910 RepID=A0A6A6ZTC6_9PLEO|nr:hypothetical protein CC86DRAFT_69475 [Ophiobolus disseminans]